MTEQITYTPLPPLRQPVLDLLTLAEVYCAHRGRALSTISTKIFSDGKIFSRIATGGDIHVSRFELALRWFSTHWPADLAWPDIATKRKWDSL
jgi:hypothetical protein